MLQRLSIFAVLEKSRSSTNFQDSEDVGDILYLHWVGGHPSTLPISSVMVLAGDFLLGWVGCIVEQAGQERGHGADVKCDCKPVMGDILQIKVVHGAS